MVTPQWLRKVNRWVGLALKAVSIPWPGYSYEYDSFLDRHRGEWYLTRKDRVDTNSIVIAVVGWVGRTFPEAPLGVWERIRDTESIVYDHALTVLVESPNPFYGGPTLWMATIADYMMTGNAYWLKVRDGRGKVVEIWWIPSMFVEPRWNDNSYLDWYDYSPQNEVRKIPQSDIVHFRYGLDPNNPRKGRSPLAAAIREVMTDNEAEDYTQTILKNLGVPGVVISPEVDTYASDKELEAIKQKYMDTFSGPNRGKPLVLTRKTSVQAFSFSPQQMDLRSLRRVPEERITAVFGIPAIVAGLGAGLDRSTFNNVGEAREAAYESLIIPMQRMLASDVQIQLLPEMGVRKRQRCAFDTSKVRVLQEDQDKLAKRLVTLFEGGLITPNEARADLGRDPATDPHADLRYVNSKLTAQTEDIDEEPAGVPLLTGGGGDGEGEDGSEEGNSPSKELEERSLIQQRIEQWLRENSDALEAR